VAPVTIVIGLVLIGLGLAGYLPSEPKAVTALIPAAFGGLLVALGAVALNEKARKHAMHLAVMVGLLGFVGAGYMAAKAGLSGNIERPLAFGMQVSMAVICAVFVGLCIKSFIDARRRRQQTGA
jgi:hypothetical protein